MAMPTGFTMYVLLFQTVTLPSVAQGGAWTPLTDRDHNYDKAHLTWHP